MALQMLSTSLFYLNYNILVISCYEMLILRIIHFLGVNITSLTNMLIYFVHKNASLVLLQCSFSCFIK